MAGVLHAKTRTGAAQEAAALGNRPLLGTIAAQDVARLGGSTLNGELAEALAAHKTTAVLAGEGTGSVGALQRARVDANAAADVSAEHEPPSSGALWWVDWDRDTAGGPAGGAAEGAASGAARAVPAAPMPMTCSF